MTGIVLMAALTAAAQGRGARTPFIPEAPVLPYVAVENPLPLPGGAEYAAVASVATDSRAHVFVLHRVPAPIAEFDATGRFVRAFGEGTASRAHSLRIDAGDNLWIVDSGDHVVTKLDARGRTLLTLGTKGVAGMGDADAAQGKLNIPSDVAFAPNGDIFVAQGEAGGPDPRVIRFTRDGRFVTTWSLAYPDGPRSNPHAIVIDREGLIYVGDRNVMRIRVFRADGTPVRDIQMRNQVCGLAIDRSQQLWMATGMDGQFMKVTWDGQVAGFASRRGTGAGELSEAHALTVAANGDVFVADTIGRKVVKFTAPHAE
jgi:streptogramin lyase